MSQESPNWRAAAQLGRAGAWSGHRGFVPCTPEQREAFKGGYTQLSHTPNEYLSSVSQLLSLCWEETASQGSNWLAWPDFPQASNEDNECWLFGNPTYKWTILNSGLRGQASRVKPAGEVGWESCPQGLGTATKAGICAQCCQAWFFKGCQIRRWDGHFPMKRNKTDPTEQADGALAP